MGIMAAMEHLEITRDAGTATVTLNRPDKKNALHEALLGDIPKAIADLGQDRSVRTVVLRGAGGDFSAGIDLGFLQSMLPKIDDIKAIMRGPVPNFFQAPAMSLAAIPQPVVAVIEGVCIGAGLQLALGADIRIAHPDARFSIMEAKWGLIPDMGITQSLPKLMRADQAKELIMTARMLTATDAQAVGLVTHVSADPMAHARELASEIATRSPDAVAGSKTLVDSTWAVDVQTALATEGALQADLMGSPNQMEAVMAGMTKRAPSFG